MSEDLMKFFNELEDRTEKRESYVRAPFGYMGGKSRSVEKILPHLPYEKIYVEPFGGSAAILLARQESKLEVFNDRYAGVVAFYRVIRSEEKMKKLLERLDLVIHSREEFVWCKDTWKDCDDDIERAARWYYMLQCSFVNKGKYFARSTRVAGNVGNKLRNNLDLFPAVHSRFKNVQIENQDWRNIVKDYDNHEAVFYLDPPYLTANTSIYEHELKKHDHIELLDTVMNMKSFVAMSGYANELYDKYDWDDRITWDIYMSAQSMANDFEKGEKRVQVQEVLWIKEAK